MKVDTQKRKDYNPGETHAAEQFPDDSSYITHGLDQLEADANNPDNHSETVKDREARAGQDGRIKYTGKHRQKKAEISGSPLKKKGPLTFIIASLGLGGLSIGGFLTTLGPITGIENIWKDLDDASKALDNGMTGIMRNKIPTEDRKAALRGCTVLSLRCKFATLSETQVARMAAKSIEVVPSKQYTNLLRLKRIVPEFYKFQGNQFTPAEWKVQLETNRAAARAQRAANNMKYVGTASQTFIDHVLKRFGVEKRPPELKGTSQERVNELLNKAGTNNPSELHFTAVKNDEGETTGYTLDGDIGDPPTTYTQSQVDTMEQSIADIQDPKPPINSATRNSLAAVSAIGYADLACSISNMIGAATIAAKVANNQEAIAYAMPIASSVHQMKDGDITAENAEVLGKLFTETDTRQQVTDVTASIEGDDLATMDNPNYGKSALDSSLYQMSVTGNVVSPVPQFSLGMGQNQLLAGFAATQAVIHEIVNAGAANACPIIQSWGVRILGTVASVALTIGTAGTFGVGQAVTMGVMIAAMFTIQAILNNALTGSLITDADLESDTVARGDALWTGMSGIASASAQSYGLMPGSAEEVADYTIARHDIEQEYIAIESEDAHPLDIYNQYSFLGSFARSLLKYTSTSSSMLSNIGSIISRGTFGSLTENARAKVVDIKRFEQCDDKAYRDIGIGADVQCNVRFVMTDEDLKKLETETDPVAAWMEGEGYVERETTTGYPKGYTPVDPASAQKGIRGFITGTVDSFTGQFIDKRAASIEDYNDYAKFLDYCAYRTMPFGDTFEDNHPANGADMDWITGKRCREKSTKLSNFRIYTIHKAVEEGIDTAYSGSTVPAPKTTAPGANDE
jgi:hypothetical protein